MGENLLAIPFYSTTDPATRLCLTAYHFVLLSNCVKDARSRFGRVLQYSPAAILMLVTPLLAACAPICETVNSWSACYSDLHGDDSSAVHSEIDEPPVAEHADAVGRARPFVRAFVVEENLPGLSLAVGMAGEVVWAEGFGWADIDERRPVTPRTQFRIGGVAKPMTAAAVGLLLERGELDIDLPARHYVPSFPEKPWSFTTRQLMGHIAGFRHYRDDELRGSRQDQTLAASLASDRAAS